MLINLFPLYLYLQRPILLFLQELLLQLLFRSTNRVLSNIDLTITFPICGFLYGGSSNINDVGTPFNIVFESIFDIKSVNTIPNIIISKTDIVAAMDEKAPVKKLPIKIIAIVIKNGNLPLHGMKLFVSIDINFSLGESIILQPTTPAALQPSPMHMVMKIW